MWSDYCCHTTTGMMATVSLQNMCLHDSVAACRKMYLPCFGHTLHLTIVSHNAEGQAFGFFPASSE
jgi:hypothetical protein